MNASDVMTRGVVTASPFTTVEAAARVMIQHRISGLPVIDANGAVIGIVTEADLLRRVETGTDYHISGWRALLLGPERLAEQYVRAHARNIEEIMTRDVVTITSKTPLVDVVALMESRRVKRLPVLEHGRLVGIVSRADLLRALEQLLPKGDASVVADASIRRRIVAELERQHWAPRSCVDIKVEEGTVELRGIFFEEAERDALRVLVENTPGVKKVIDHLMWVEPYTGFAVDVAPNDANTKP